jgi:hypothetical protein
MYLAAPADLQLIGKISEVIMSENGNHAPFHGKPLIGMKMIATYLGVSAPTAAEFIQQGMPAKKMGNKVIASPANIDAWFAAITKANLKGQELSLEEDG